MDDQEIARRAIDFQNRAKDYGLIEIPGYMAWSERKLREGTPEVLIAHLDATGMCLLPEDMAKVTEADFDEMLNELIERLGE